MRFILAALFIFRCVSASADVPKVVTDIAPVHSIVSVVLGDLGEPDLIMPPGASPHDHSLRPSEARMLDQADVVVWIGAALTPWLENAAATLAEDSVQIILLQQSGTKLLALREGGAFGEDGHDHGADDDHSGHKHGGGNGIDAHAWLDPQNASVWATAIAERMAHLNPENASAFRNNAKAFGERMAALTKEVDKMLDPVRGRPFVVFHDAYHYFEHRFGIEAIGAITETDAIDARPARLAALRTEVERIGAVCVLTEPQFNPGIVTAIGAAELGELDPIGATLEPGPNLYQKLIRNMAQSLSECLK